MSAQFRLRNTKNLEVKNKKSTNPEKKANISRIPSSIPPRLSKKVLEKSKFYKGKGKTSESQNNIQNRCSYAQVFKSNIKYIVEIKDNFPNLSAKKIKEVYKVLNEPKKDKPRLNITIKGLSGRQVLVPMSLNNSEKFIMLSSHQGLSKIRYGSNID